MIENSSKRSGTYSHQNPPVPVSSAVRPGASASPTGRMPQDRSRLPSHVDGSTAIVSPPTRTSPVQVPSCAKRVLCRMVRNPLLMMCGSSSTASNEPSHVRSRPTPWSSPSQTTRTRCSGSSTSMRYGPTCWCIRSGPMASEKRAVRMVSPTFTVA